VKIQFIQSDDALQHNIIHYQIQKNRDTSLNIFILEHINSSFKFTRESNCKTTIQICKNFSHIIPSKK
jgi:hypothetical protein